MTNGKACLAGQQAYRLSRRPPAVKPKLNFDRATIRHKYAPNNHNKLQKKPENQNPKRTRKNKTQKNNRPPHTKEKKHQTPSTWHYEHSDATKLANSWLRKPVGRRGISRRLVKKQATVRGQPIKNYRKKKKKTQKTTPPQSTRRR